MNLAAAAAEAVDAVPADPVKAVPRGWARMANHRS